LHGSHSLDGLLSDDGLEQPRSVWWAYKAYGAVNGTLLNVNSTSATDAVAAYDQASSGGGWGASTGSIGGGIGGGGGDEDGGKFAILSLLLGVKAGSSDSASDAVSFCGPGTHHGGAAPPGTTTHSVQFRNLPAELLEPGGAAVTVAVIIIPDSRSATMVGTPRVQTRRSSVTASTVAVDVTLPARTTGGGAAALILLGRGA